MILQALARYYDRLIAKGGKGIAPYGYSPEKISFEILLDHAGRTLQVNDLRDTTGKKPIPRLIEVPQPTKRTSGIKSNFLWDKSSYVLGVSSLSKRATQEHEAFRNLHETALSNTQDPGLLALLRFVRSWSPSQYQRPLFTDEMLDTNLVFRLDGERRFLHQREAARVMLYGLKTGAEDHDGITATCLVTGDNLPLARLHPPIKGVAGAQSSGASIVSFNLEAFSSFGKSQGENAPISEQAAFAYTTVLNHLLRPGRHNRQFLRVADASLVFWAEAADPDQAETAELVFADLLDPPPDDTNEAERVRHILEATSKGRPLSELDPGLDPKTRIYVLGLAPNASRLSVRFWQVDTLEIFTRRLAQHSEDLHIEPLPWRTEPTIRRLAFATVPNRAGATPKADDIINNLVGEMMRAILGGGLYPRSLLANTVMRIRADGNLSGLRVAICKGVLTRERRLGIYTSEEDLPVSLDRDSNQPGYLLGRLFAVLEGIQRAALGKNVNATIRDRYYGAASATPASIFPVLLRNTQNHLGKLRKDKPGLAVIFEKEIIAIVMGLSEQFPRSLRIEDQGRFAIGYFHQAHSLFEKHEPNEDNHLETTPEAEGDQS